jgi:hypothetical protein
MGVKSMTTSGLVITFHPQFAEQSATVECIRQAGPFTLGEQVDNRLPVALEAPTPRDSESWCAWLRKLPGVMNVDVASVEYGEQEEVDENP